MNIIRRLAEIPPPLGHRAIVPTMGALHEGHAELMRVARQECEEVLATIFVNPLQFGPTEDFLKYPRQEAEDIAIAEACGVDILVIPSVEEMYPLGQGEVKIHVADIGDLWEGSARPGHFDGVATVVAKLFNFSRCDRAYFGRKDLQQCALINRMIQSLSYCIDLRVVDTVREEDGLALSSRNVYLNQEERRIAPMLYQTLSSARDAILSAQGGLVRDILTKSREELQRKVKLDYFDLVDFNTMKPVDSNGPDAVLIVAAYLGSTRLIDNLPISASWQPQAAFRS